MRDSIIGKVIGVIILFYSLIVLPTYFVGVIQWRNDMNTCQAAARNYVDMIIDNGQITERAVTDLNLSLGSCYSTFTYNVYREEKITNPTGTSWVYVDIEDDTVWRTGDIVTIEITQEGSNIFQSLSAMMLGTSYQKVDVRLAGMVR